MRFESQELNVVIYNADFGEEGKLLASTWNARNKCIYLDTHSDESFEMSVTNQRNESLCLHADKLINHKRKLTMVQSRVENYSTPALVERPNVLLPKRPTGWHHCLGRFHSLAWASQAVKLVLGRTRRADPSLLCRLVK